MLVHDPRRARTVAYDFFTSVPGLDATDRPIAPLEELRVEFGTTTQLFLVGPGSCAVPGNAVGLHEAHRRGGRLPFARLVEPAIALARTGATLNRGQADLHAILDPLLRQRPAAAEVFGPEGRMLVEGESVRNLALATTLERYAERGAEEFATGRTAQSIVEAQEADGGPVTARDLRDYRVIARRPVRASYRGAEVLTNPPPSSGGILIAHALGVLERLASAGRPARRPRAGRAGARPALGAGAAGAALRARPLPGRRPLARARGRAHRRGRGDTASARGRAAVRPRHLAHQRGRRGGGAASMTSSTGCGSGWFAGDTGVHMNNMLGESDLALASLVLRPGERITSMMSPTLVLGRDGAIRLVVGAPGRPASARPSRRC